METYPDILYTIPSAMPLEISTAQAVLKTEFENGREQRRLMWDSPRRNVHVTYNVMSFEDAQTLREFYEEMDGSFRRFAFVLPHIITYVKENVGVTTTIDPGLGALLLNLPSRDAQTYTLYMDNVEYTTWDLETPRVKDWDRAILTGDVPPIGSLFTFSFTGRLVIDARFSEDPLSFSHIKTHMSSTSVDIVGLEHQP